MKKILYLGIPILALGVSIGLNKFKKSDLVQKVVAIESQNLDKKIIQKFQPFIKGDKTIYVAEGTGFYDLIDEDLKLKEKQKKYGWRNDELAVVYKHVNGGNLRFPGENKIPVW